MLPRRNPKIAYRAASPAVDKAAGIGSVGENRDNHHILIAALT